MQFSWNLPRLVLIGDGFTDPECADRIVDAAANSSVGGRGVRDLRGPQGALWVHLRDRAAPDGLFRECAVRLTERLRCAAPSAWLSVNGRPEVAEALRCGYHAGVRDPAPLFAGGSRRPFGRSAHNPGEARAALGEGRPDYCQDSATGEDSSACDGAFRGSEAHRPQYFFFSPVFDPGSKPGCAGAGVGALRDFADAANMRFVDARAVDMNPAGRRIPVYALGGVTPERVGSCLDAGSYGVAALSGIMTADRPAEAADDYFDALRACLKDAL